MHVRFPACNLPPIRTKPLRYFRHVPEPSLFPIKPHPEPPLSSADESILRRDLAPQTGSIPSDQAQAVRPDDNTLRLPPRNSGSGKSTRHVRHPGISACLIPEYPPLNRPFAAIGHPAPGNSRLKAVRILPEIRIISIPHPRRGIPTIHPSPPPMDIRMIPTPLEKITTVLNLDS